MTTNYSIANYSGKQPNNTSYIKTFTGQSPLNLWKSYTYKSTTDSSYKASVITPTSIKNLYIPGNIILDGNLITPSDETLKDNIIPIKELTTNITEHLSKITPVQYIFKEDLTQQIHYGFIAQQIKEFFPNLVIHKPHILTNDTNENINSDNSDLSISISNDNSNLSGESFRFKQYIEQSEDSNELTKSTEIINSLDSLDSTKSTTLDNNINISGVNYIEFIPLLLHKIQQLENDINQLKETIQKKEINNIEQKSSNTKSTSFLYFC